MFAPLLIACLAQGAQADLPLLRIGEVVEGVIEDGDPVVHTGILDGGNYDRAPTVCKTFLIKVEDSGPYHVELRSYFFDTYLVLRDAQGALLTEDDDGLIRLHSRLTVDLVAGKSYRLLACALHGRRGGFELTLSRGRPRRLGPNERANETREDARRGLSILERALEPHHPDIATSLNDLAVLLTRQGDNETARPLYERALAIREKVFGPDHNDTITSFENLASLLDNQGDHDAERKLYERTLANWRLVAPEHPHTALILVRLTTLLMEQGDYHAARPLLEGNLSVWEETVGSELTALSLNNLASLLELRGDHDAARPLLESALAIREKALGAEHPDTLKTLDSLAGLLRDQGDYDGARPFYERALAIREKLASGEPDTATCLNDLAAVLYHQADFDAARPLFERALAIREKVLGPDDLETVNSLSYLALVLLAQDEHEAARPCLERALEIHEKTLGPEHPNTAQSLNNLAVLLQAEGDYDAARELIERAIAIDEKHGLDGREAAICLSNLAGLLQALGDYDAARPLLERALAFYEELGPEHPGTASQLNSLAILYTAQGDYDAARPLLERALTIREQVLGPEHPDTATSLNNMALLFLREGGYEAARPLHERALAICEKALGPEHSGTADCLSNLAQLLLLQGDFEAARPLLERALAIKKKVLRPEHPAIATILNNLGVLLTEQGDYDSAQPFHERALAIRDQTLGSDHPDTAQSLDNLAMLLCYKGDYSSARPLLERALTIRERLGPEHPDTATSLNNLALFLRARGNYDAARPLFERALAICERNFGRDHPSSAMSANNLVLLLLDQGKSRQAWETAERGREQLERRHVRFIASLSEGERYQFLAENLWRVEVTLSVSSSLGDPGSRVRAYEDVLAWKGQISRALLASRARLAARMKPGQRQGIEALRSVQARLSALAFSLDVDDLEVYEKRLRELRDERNRLEIVLQRSIDPTDLGKVAASFSSLRSVLPERSAVLDFFVHRIYEPARWNDNELLWHGGLAEPRLSVWITQPGHELVSLDLGPTTAVEDAVQDYLGAISSSRGESPVREGVNASIEESGGILRERLWDPLTPYLEGVEQIIVSPDNFVGTLPFEVIPLDDASYLIERHSFVYLQDAASLVDQEGALDASLDSLLAVGAVDFRKRARWIREEAEAEGDSPDTSYFRSKFGDYWPRLPSTRFESQVVFDMHEDSFDGDNRLLLQGAEPSEERLKHELQQYSVLHLATHGFFNPEGIPSMWEAALKATEEGREGLIREARHLVGKHPGLLSGLVCAGANNPEEGREDGYLTAEEVGWLDLTNVELVVLSACETGLGRPKSGEGLIGLRRAFRTAGAKTVVGSLWSVRDESTAELMRDFYKNLWLKGMGRLEALREAQLAMLNKNRMEHGDPLPSTWGAFVLSGEWR